MKNFKTPPSPSVLFLLFLPSPHNTPKLPVESCLFRKERCLASLFLHYEFIILFRAKEQRMYVKYIHLKAALLAPDIVDTSVCSGSIAAFSNSVFH